MRETYNCIFNPNKKKTDELFKHQPNLSEEDQFRACFIDCSAKENYTKSNNFNIKFSYI